MEEDYASMTVSELKELLKERDLKVSGKKSELVERLLESDGVEISDEEEDAEENTEEEDAA